MNRRRVLATVGAVVASSTAGCLETVTGTGNAGGTDTATVSERAPDTATTSGTERSPSTDTEPDTRTPRGTAGLPTRFWLERVTLSASERGSVDPIVFADLSPAEKEVVRTALDEGEYTVQREHGDPALDDLRDRIEARTDGGLTAYLRRGETYYRVGFAAGDHIIAHPDH
jgi:hypothetical protein